MSKFQIDLRNYPYLLKLFNEDKAQFALVVRDLLANAEKLYGKTNLVDKFEQHQEESMRVFNRPVVDIVVDVVDAFFDYKGITSNHVNEQEAELLEYLEHENNPLSIFTGYTIARDQNGKQITKQQFLGERITFKDYLQRLLYTARYLDYEQYLAALTVSNYDLMEASKHENIVQLMQIQPALEYQKLNGLIVGSRKKGTAFFDCGKAESNVCPISKKEMLETEEGYYSLDSLAYFSKGE